MVIGNHKFRVVTTTVYKSNQIIGLDLDQKNEKNKVNWNENNPNVVKMIHKFLSFDSFTLWFRDFWNIYESWVKQTAQLSDW